MTLLWARGESSENLAAFLTSSSDGNVYSVSVVRWFGRFLLVADDAPNYPSGFKDDHLFHENTDYMRKQIHK